MGVSPQDENVEEEQSPHHEDGDDPDVSMNVQIRASTGIVRRSRPRRHAIARPGLCSRTVMARS